MAWMQRSKRHQCNLPEFEQGETGMYICMECWKYWEYAGFGWVELITDDEKQERFIYYIGRKVKEKMERDAR